LTVAALVVYGVVLAAGCVAIWRRPELALLVFVVGLAFHNAAMDALYGAGVRGHALTAIQAWKDIFLAVAFARVARDAVRARRLPFRFALPDWLALAFAALVVLYAVIPQGWLDGNATTKGIAYALRHDLTGVAAYFLGRAVVPDWRRVRWAALVVAGVVAAWGLIDVYAISLDWWRHNGTVGYFRDQLDYHYTPALSGLPENFIYNPGGESDVLRRLISTFLSPLAAAYVCGVALLLAPRTRAAVPVAVIAAAGLLWAYTRAALVALAVALALAALVTRKPGFLVAAGATAVVAIVFAAAFPHIGPTTEFTRAELEWQRSNARPAPGEAQVPTSTESHANNFTEGVRTVVHHPQGFGLGNAGEIAFRTGTRLRAGESNYTELGVEAGLLGALLFIAWNVSLLWALVREHSVAVAAALAFVLVVALQTDAYGIPWLAYCLWWLAGSALTAPRRAP
jgi:hypothetical protein